MDLASIFNVTNPNTISAPVIVGSLAYIIGFLLKKSPVASWLIPWVLVILGGAIYPFVIDLETGHTWVREVIYGMGYAGSAVVANQLYWQTKTRDKKTKKQGGGTIFYYPPVNEKSKNPYKKP